MPSVFSCLWQRWRQRWGFDFFALALPSISIDRFGYSITLLT